MKQLVLANAPETGFLRGISDWKNGVRNLDDNPFSGDVENPDGFVLALSWESGMFLARAMTHKEIEF